MDTFLEVLKWIGIALAAGFVGYFGRYPSKMLINKTNGHKTKPPERPPAQAVENGVSEELKSRQKIEKKKAKKAVKIVKKQEES